SIFPNPSNGIVNIELNATTSAAVTVVDVLGQVIYSSNTSFVAGQRQMIDLSNNAKGMYILSVEGEGVNTVERITIK
ncbi:MAG: T9SS type A sorting domain-containing protein, partial [Schleiferiaceae bacterium]|nr:T9SS type A sorting domain-containing protein [Schleiferiaceae bacterium]